jgi:hypothetical protein
LSSMVSVKNFFYLFNKMPQFGREPDGTTYLGVFSHSAMEGS